MSSAKTAAAEANERESHAVDSHSSDPNTSPDQKKVRRMRIKWDEETIKEHDKLRGTRMKIDEPDTPFNAEYVPSDDEGDSAGGESEHKIEDQVEGVGALSGGLAAVSVPTENAKRVSHGPVDISSHLGELAETLRKDPTSRWENQSPSDIVTGGGNSEGSDKDSEAAKRAKAKAFAAKRAQHYNMGEQMRLAKLAIQKEMEEEEAAERAAAEKATAAGEASV